MRIAIVAIVKDEALYLTEWLAYHLALGVDSVVIYDNDSTDGTTDILAKASLAFPIETVPWPSIAGKSPQFSAYANYLSRPQRDDCLTGFLDLDEFLTSTDGTNPVESLRHLGSDPSVSAVCLNQRIYGDSGHTHYSPEPVLERFARCAPSEYHEHRWLKSFYKLPAVDRLSIHSSPLKYGRHVHPNGETVRFATDKPFSVSEHIDHATMQINHYITKSLEEFASKARRGDAAASDDGAGPARYGREHYDARQLAGNIVDAVHPFAGEIGRIISEFRAKVSDSSALPRVTIVAPD